jgi:DNA-binding response OmpR family regulator
MTRFREPIEPVAERIRRPTALVVDDDFWIRALVCDLLEDEGYTVEQASNGSAALRLARRQPPQVMLLDLALPELSGLSVLASMKADWTTRQVPVIVVSGEAAVARAVAHWAAAVVPKPFVLADLLATVAHALRAPFEIVGQRRD